MRIPFDDFLEIIPNIMMIYILQTLKSVLQTTKKTEQKQHFHFECLFLKYFITFCKIKNRFERNKFRNTAFLPVF